MEDSPGGCDGGGGDLSQTLNAREQDRFLPVANISRIMKKALPANGKIAKDAKDVVQECVSEFVSFITSEASDKCVKEKRKTVNGDDLLWAMETLGFEEYVKPLKIYLSRYRQFEGDLKGVVKVTDESSSKNITEAQFGHQGSFAQDSFLQGSFSLDNYSQDGFPQDSSAEGSLPEGSFGQGSFSFPPQDSSPPQGFSYSSPQDEY